MAVPFPFDAWAKPGKDVFEFWISFFPTAPLFGVEWRFAGAVNPALNPFMQAGAMPFPMPFPDTRAAGAAARPGELDTPALADEDAARPLARAAEIAAGAAEEAGRIAAGTGRATARTALTAVKAGAETVARTGGDDAVTGISPAPDSESAAVATQEVGEKAEERSTTREAAETAMDEVRSAQPATQAAADLFDAAIAAAPRPEALLAERPEDPDDLRSLKGIGASLERQLNELGVWKFEQIARMSDADLAWIDSHLTTVPGRCFRDDWVGQAKARLGK